jgi:hypothetical protein
MNDLNNLKNDIIVILAVALIFSVFFGLLNNNYNNQNIIKLTNSNAMYKAKYEMLNKFKLKDKDKDDNIYENKK